MPSAVIGAVGSVAGGLLGASASSSAARAQERSAQAATDEQRRQFDLTRQDMEPWRTTGQAGLNRLAYLMGIGGTGTGGGQGMLTEAQLRQQLLPQYTTAGTPGTPQPPVNPQTGQTISDAIYTVDPMTGQWGWRYFDSDRLEYQWMPGDGEAGSAGSVDEAGLSAAIQQQLAQQQAQQAAAQNDPEYGSLLRSFGMQDYLEDPGYQFRMQQGEQAINRSAAAAGRYDSGRALKDLTEFNSGLASQEFGNAYNRWNADQTNRFNRLAALSNVGQTATNQVATHGLNMANNVANNTMQAGNARASGYMGQANAWGGAVGGVTNALAQYFQGNNSSSNTGGSGTFYGLKPPSNW